MAEPTDAVDTPDPSAISDEPAVTTSPPAATTTSTSAPAPSTTSPIVIVVNSDPLLAGGGDDLVARRDECRLEWATVFTSLQAYMNQTGAVPRTPDAMVRTGWLEEHPEGWSARWSIVGIDGGIAVVPVAGTRCDL
jgi:hypothetical protein